LTAGDIRNDRDPIAYLETFLIIIKRNNFCSKLVAKNARVSEEWLFATKCMIICAADANSVDTKQCFP
jgi:hypothetical protein